MKRILLTICMLLAMAVQSHGRNGFGNYKKQTPAITTGNGVEITVNNVYRRKELPDGNEAPDRRRYLVLDLRIQNTGTEKFHANPTCFALIAGDETCEGTGYRWNWKRCFDCVDLRPGTGMNGMVKFEIPFKASSFKLFYDPTAGSEFEIKLPEIK